MLIKENPFSAFIKKFVFNVAYEKKPDTKIFYIEVLGVKFYDISNVVYKKNLYGYHTILNAGVTPYSLTSILKNFIADMFGVELRTKNKGNTSVLTVEDSYDSLAAAIITTLMTLPLTLLAIIIGTPALIAKYLAKIVLLKIFPNEQYLSKSVAIAASIILFPFNVIYALANIVPSFIRTFIQKTVVNGGSNAYKRICNNNHLKIEAETDTKCALNKSTNENEKDENASVLKNESPTNSNISHKTNAKEQRSLEEDNFPVVQCESTQKDKSASVLKNEESPTSSNISYETNAEVQTSLIKLTTEVENTAKEMTRGEKEVLENKNQA